MWMYISLNATPRLSSVCLRLPLVVNHLLGVSLIYRTDSGRREREGMGGCVCEGGGGLVC